MKDLEKTIVMCSHEFAFPVERVFEAFLDPVTLTKWYGPRDSTVGKLSLNPVVGGNYAIELISARHGRLLTKGVYHVIDRYRRLQFSFQFEPDITLAGDSLVTVDFEHQNGRTRIALRQVMEKLIDPIGRTQGWEQSFERLQAFLESLDA